MPSMWIAAVISACTFCGALAVVEFSGGLSTLVKAVYAVSILGLAAYLAMHGSDEDADAVVAPTASAMPADGGPQG